MKDNRLNFCAKKENVLYIKTICEAKHEETH